MRAWDTAVVISCGLQAVVMVGGQLMLLAGVQGLHVTGSRGVGEERWLYCAHGVIWQSNHGGNSSPAQKIMGCAAPTLGTCLGLVIFRAVLLGACAIHWKTFLTSLFFNLYKSKPKPVLRCDLQPLCSACDSALGAPSGVRLGLPPKQYHWEEWGLGTAGLWSGGGLCV